MNAKQLELTNFLNAIINELEIIKNHIDDEIESEYFTLSCIAYRLEIFSAGGIRRRRGRLDTDSDSDNDLIP